MLRQELPYASLPRNLEDSEQSLAGVAEVTLDLIHVARTVRAMIALALAIADTW